MSPRCALVLAVLSCSIRTPHPADAPPGDSFELDVATEEARPDPAERLETADPGGPVVPPLCVPAGEEGLPVPVQDFFAPESETRPFPNLALSVADPTSPTGLRPWFTVHPMRGLLNRLDGFGATAPFVVPLPFEPDPSSAADGVLLVRTLDADASALDPDRLSRDRVPIRVGYNRDAAALVVEPLVPLAEREPYALVVTRCVRDASGRLLARAPAMDRAFPQGHPFAVQMDRALRYLARDDVNLQDPAIAIVLPAVTRSTASRLRALHRPERLPEPAPVIEWARPPARADGTLDPEFLDHFPGLADLVAKEFPADQIPLYDFEAIGVAAAGRFTVRRFLDPAVFVDPAAQTPAFEDLEVPFFLTLPAVAASEHGPPFPVVVFQHAFGVCKETALALAGAFSREGLAVLAVDAIAHGSRAPGGYQCPTDPTGFLTLDDPLRLWFNFAESVLESAQAARMASALDVDLWPWPDGDGEPDLTNGVIGFIGQSMGAFLGAVVLGLERSVGPVVLNVGGGQEGLFFGWGMASSIGLDPWDLSFASLPGIALDIMGPMQMAMDDVEPLVFAQGMFGPSGLAARHLLMQQAVEDEVVPAEVTARLARACGVERLAPGFRAVTGLSDVSPPVRGNLAGSHTAVLAQFSPAEHAFLLVNDNPEQDPALLHRGQAQAAHFFRTFFDAGVPEVTDPYAADPRTVASPAR